MKRGTLRHKKLMRLASILGIPRLYAAGILEALWHWTAETAPSGDLGDTTPDEIAVGIGYEGDAKALVSALVSAKWIDKSRHGAHIHDWYEHADYDVHAAVARRREWFAGGQVPKLSKVRREDRAEAEAFYANTQRIRKVFRANRALPCLAKPCPASIAPASTQPQDGSSASPPDDPPGFARFWDVWPKHDRKTGRKQCLTIWHKQKLEPLADTIIAGVERDKRGNQWTKDRGQWIPMPATWLNQGRWEGDTPDPDAESTATPQERAAWTEVQRRMQEAGT